MQTCAGRASQLLLLTVVSPVAFIVFLAVSLLVLLDTGGPVLHRCVRAGRNGRPFLMLKFRTMHPGMTGPPVRARDDHRHTRVGRFLSRTRLDELPQLWNVARGDMRLVGPRPEAPEFVACQPEAYAEILTVRPGLTGPAQLAFHDESLVLAGVPAEQRRSFYVERLLPEKVRIDQHYVRNRSARLNAAILLRTLALPVAALAQAGRRQAAAHEQHQCQAADGHGH